MAVIKRISIKDNAGNYTYHNLGAEGQNVSLANGDTLEERLNIMAETIEDKVDAEEGKGLSTNDYTTVEKNKLNGIEAGAQVNTISKVNNKTGEVTLTNTDVGAAPTAHASANTTYGAGDTSNYGHVKLSDAYTGTGSAASASVAASSKAVTDLRANTMPDMKTVAAHNSIYRGEELLSASHFGTGSTGLTALKNAVSSGNFNDIYVGDTITTTMAAISGYESASQTVVWIVMGINMYYNNGDTALTKNHLVLVPKDAFKTLQKMNDSDVTTGGYAGSKMFKTILPAYKTAISNSLGSFILTYRDLLSTEVDTTKVSGGYSGLSGASSSWVWTDTTITLLNEVEVYGTRVWSSSSYDVGKNCIQLPGFAMNPMLKIKGQGNNGSRYTWWLSSVVHSASFARVNIDGCANDGHASNAFGVVPKVLFGA